MPCHYQAGYFLGFARGIVESTEHFQLKSFPIEIISNKWELCGNKWVSVNHKSHLLEMISTENAQWISKTIIDNIVLILEIAYIYI